MGNKWIAGGMGIGIVAVLAGLAISGGYLGGNRTDKPSIPAPAQVVFDDPDGDRLSTGFETDSPLAKQLGLDPNVTEIIIKYRVQDRTLLPVVEDGMEQIRASYEKLGIKMHSMYGGEIPSDILVDSQEHKDYVRSIFESPEERPFLHVYFYDGIIRDSDGNVVGFKVEGAHPYAEPGGMRAIIPGALTDYQVANTGLHESLHVIGPKIPFDLQYVDKDGNRDEFHTNIEEHFLGGKGKIGTELYPEITKDWIKKPIYGDNLI